MMNPPRPFSEHRFIFILIHQKVEKQRNNKQEKRKKLT